MDYQKMGEKLKNVLKLEREPVAIKWVSREPKIFLKKRENPDSAPNWTRL